MAESLITSGMGPQTCPSSTTTSSVRQKPRAPRYRNYWARRNPDDYAEYPKLKPLGYRTQVRLIEKAQRNDVEALRTVWLHAARLAFSVINRLSLPEPILADAIQEGQLGIHRAIMKFEVEHLTDFSTYAWHWINQSIRRMSMAQRFSIRCPNHLYAPYCAFAALMSRQPTRRDLFDCLQHHRENEPHFKAIWAIYRIHHAEPIDAIDVRWHPTTDNEPFESCCREEIRSILEDALGRLPSRDRDILVARFGFHGGRCLTLEELGLRYGLTRERVRQIEKRALQELRRLLLRFSISQELNHDPV